MITQLKKRSGTIAPFEPTKITNAVSKAFLEVVGTASLETIDPLTTRVVERLETLFPDGRIPGVEDVQNAVEHILMESGYWSVARAYIIYRYEHTKKREEKKQEVLKRIAEDGLFVTKRSGEREAFSFEKLKRSLLPFVDGIEDAIEIDRVLTQCRNELYDDIPTPVIEQSLILAARSFIEKDPAYSKLASRLLRWRLFKDAVGQNKIDYRQFDTLYRKTFIQNIHLMASTGRLDPRVLLFDLEYLASILKPERDDLFDYLGIQVLQDRYLISHPKTKVILETPQAFWMRVAMGQAILEADRNEKAASFYEVLSTMRFVNSTPTLFHSGTNHPQLSSCYLTFVDDDLDHIFKCYGDNAQLSKWSGGIANDWSSLRSTGARIKKTNIESQGVIPFLKIANDVTVAINRSGKRRGATCAYLEVWHLDFEDFLELRKNTGDERRRAHDMNTAAWIPDLFMKRLRDGGDWTFFSPEETPDLHHIYGRAFEEAYIRYEQKAREGGVRLHRTIKAQELWRKMIASLFETGHPWITWKDPSNVRSPQDHAGVVHCSNLCTEITLNNSREETAVCNLGSVSLQRHIVNGVLDVELLKETVTLAMRMLDNVIDLNYYPTKEGLTSNMRHRPVGLGVMGFQELLFEMNLDFGSMEAIELADRTMETVSYYAILASAELAKERGAYSSFRGSKWDRGILPVDTLDLLEAERAERIPVSRKSTLDWSLVRAKIKEHGMRNSNCLAIAPTATISNIADCTPSIEPIYKNIYVKSNMSGEFVVINTYLVNDLKKIGLWNDETIKLLKQHDGDLDQIPTIPDVLRRKYRDVFSIDPMHLVTIAAHRGKWIDQSQSLNIFYNGTSGKELSNIYLHAWSLGLKTTYYLRTMAASDVEKSTVELKKAAPASAPAPEMPSIVPLPFVAATTASPSDTVMTPEGPVKLCKLNDPTCEACQ